jgi:AcrR family transcriptional regulator
MGAKRKMNDIFSPGYETPAAISLRERKKQLVQATIEETALRLFQQKGYEQTSIQDIASAVMMSTRTFFRYFASKEEVLLGSTHAALHDALQYLQQLAPLETPQAALRATFLHLARRYQDQRASFLSRYLVAKQTPSIASIYLYALMEREQAIAEALHSRLEPATDRIEIQLLVGIYMTAFRIAVEQWLNQGAEGELASLLCVYLDRSAALACQM